ncbi:O-acetyl-ADP-ribose deacetylase [Mucilaginibacter robiniae]|uniref:O-acetyl-ADP-ribose deacetylase n=1 Tax=Mucilaginibacter robiniae TaxID=2728022 RepID=A0A7L5DTM6_9SPHI|nr:O-acetyl-ADP-ribose deacetylase [Mucilaginibacter robiniae]QJD94450.1 O-acetyl-ADP-ribose deacetylase [Mucilaginibacter robiniae]
MNKRIELLQGDITKLYVDAIVNAANSSLLGGGGVDGAIHRAGGKQILEECRAIIAHQGRCHTGEAVITSGGRLPAKYVIHTVGPVWNGGKKNEAELLANCYTHSLQLAVEHSVKTIAFPNISTGVYRYPKTEAAQVAVDAVNAFLQQNTFLDKVTFICFDAENLTLYEELLNKL